MYFRRAMIALTVVLATLKFAPPASSDTVSVYWDNVALNHIQQTGFQPQLATRMIDVMHAAMYDAWTAYDPIAVPSRSNGILKRPPKKTPTPIKSRPSVLPRARRWSICCLRWP